MFEISTTIFLPETGNVCGPAGHKIEDTCYLSVGSDQPQSCQDIFQSNSHAAFIKSEEEHDAIRNTFLLLGIPNFIYYRIGVIVWNSSAFFWEDGTSVIFNGFSEDLSEKDLSDNLDYCVFLELENNLQWEVKHCTSSEPHTGTLCQLGKFVT